MVVCHWACFNPCWSATDAQFAGTFRPIRSQDTEDIPVINAEQTTALEQSIGGSEKQLTANDVPESDVAETATPDQDTTETSDAPQPESDDTMRFTQVRISTDKGLTLEGPDIRLSV